MTLVDSLMTTVIISQHDSLRHNAIIHIIGSLLGIVIIIMSDSLNAIVIIFKSGCCSLGLFAVMQNRSTLKLSDYMF